MKRFLTVICLIVINTCYAQDFKFGKVSKEELLEKKHPVDTAAHAAVLNISKKVYYDYRKDEGFIQVNEIVERIKIYDQEGYDYATKQVRLYDQSSINRQELKGLRGYTYFLDNGKVESSKLKNENIFDEKINDYWALKKFTMPNINDGVVIEYEYRIESPFIRIDDIVLQENIPINKLDLEVKIPEYFNFNKLLNPKSNFYPEVTETTKERIESIYSRETGMGNGGTNFQTQTGTSELRFNEKITEVHQINIPALQVEAFVDNINNYRAKLVWECTHIQPPNGQIEYFSSTWDQVVKTIYESEDFGGQLQKTNYFEKDIDMLTQNVSEPFEKASLIYNFIKTKVRWNDFVGYNALNGVKKAYKEGEGNVADINLMLIAMLRYAGLNANPVLISTRSNGIPVVATKNGFNYVIAAIEVPEGLIMLDATDLNAGPNIIPKHALNWQGRIIREHGSSAWVSLSPNKNSKEIISLNVQLNKDLSAEGKVRKLFSNYLAYNFRDNYKGINSESHISLLEKDKGDIKISNLEVTNQNELHKPVIYSYDYHLESGVEEIGDKIYFTPMLFLAPKENIFKQDIRQYPIDFIYPISEKYTINIMLPDGYVVESIPESAKIEFNVNEGEFSYLAKENGGMLQFIINLDLNKSLILPNEYDQFKKFFEFIIEKETEKVVLKKK